MKLLTRRNFTFGATSMAAMSTMAMPACAQTKSPKSMTDVIVIGAGLAGLNATLLLEEIGLTVTLIEGRNRVGGRLYTLDDVPGAPEAGGSGIGSSYGRLLDRIEQYKIPTGSERKRTEASKENTILNIAGQSIPFEKWKTHKLNPFEGEFREKLPWQFQWGIFAKDNPLGGPAEAFDLSNSKYDVSVYNYLRNAGFSHKAIMLGAGTNMSYGGSGGVHDLSTLMFFNILAFAGQNRGASMPGSPFAGSGGNQRIPEAMAKQVKSNIQMNTKVVGIRNEKDHAEIMLEDGKLLKAKHVIVTIPFSALRLIKLDAPLKPSQATAIHQLGYTNVTHLHFIPKRKFWEDDGLLPSMWTDGPTARFMALRNNTKNPKEITSFIAFANDSTADHLDRLGPKQAADYVLSYLARIRPSTKGALEFVKFWSWQLDPFAGGAYASWKPGQLSSFGQDMAASAGRVHFAGEHTAIAARGMEGAMESGERAALDIADLL